ncbi:uncharacterized protein LOC119569973 [Penaeus monodon]|uniref:uncharacterized protein LOC119569973 n=1 Tax=Penaeus monodon TaxID=6687 RepID=UPI0018A71EAE|nr:uncharacterized protein LOC119569973 [Penaeus monodon]
MVEMLRTTTTISQIRYNPQSNGLVERTNRVVKAALACVVGDRPGGWHKYVPELRLALNSAIPRSTGEQPIYLLTGRHAYFPVGSTNEAVFNDNKGISGTLETCPTCSRHSFQRRPTISTIEEPSPLVSANWYGLKRWYLIPKAQVARPCTSFKKIWSFVL